MLNRMPEMRSILIAPRTKLHVDFPDVQRDTRAPMVTHMPSAAPSSSRHPMCCTITAKNMLALAEARNPLVSLHVA